MNLPWQPTPESSTSARNKCIINPDEFDWSFERGYCATRGDRSGSGHVNGLLQKQKLNVLKSNIDLILWEIMQTYDKKSIILRNVI